MTMKFGATLLACGPSDTGPAANVLWNKLYVRVVVEFSATVRFSPASVQVESRNAGRGLTRSSMATITSALTVSVNATSGFPVNDLESAAGRIQSEPAMLAGIE